MNDLESVLQRLYELADPANLEGMTHFGLVGEKRLGIAVPPLRKLAKEIGKQHDLALALWRTGIPEAQILASMIDDPQ